MVQKTKTKTATPKSSSNSPEPNKIPIGEILYNLGYWISLAQEYYKTMNEHLKDLNNGNS